jgi:hypothetical protein
LLETLLMESSILRDKLGMSDPEYHPTYIQPPSTSEMQRPYFFAISKIFRSLSWATAFIHREAIMKYLGAASEICYSSVLTLMTTQMDRLAREIKLLNGRNKSKIFNRSALLSTLLVDLHILMLVLLVIGNGPGMEKNQTPDLRLGHEKFIHLSDFCGYYVKRCIRELSPDQIQSGHLHIVDHIWPKISGLDLSHWAYPGDHRDVRDLLDTWTQIF